MKIKHARLFKHEHIAYPSFDDDEHLEVMHRDQIDLSNSPLRCLKVVYSSSVSQTYGRIGPRKYTTTIIVTDKSDIFIACLANHCDGDEYNLYHWRWNFFKTSFKTLKNLTCNSDMIVCDCNQNLVRNQ